MSRLRSRLTWKPRCCTGCPKDCQQNLNTQDKAELWYSNSNNRCRLLFAFAFFLGHPVYIYERKGLWTIRVQQNHCPRPILIQFIVKFTFAACKKYFGNIKTTHLCRPITPIFQTIEFHCFSNLKAAFHCPIKILELASKFFCKYYASESWKTLLKQTFASTTVYLFIQIVSLLEWNFGRERRCLDYTKLARS